jgi:hypothetical protein
MSCDYSSSHTSVICVARLMVHEWPQSQIPDNLYGSPSGCIFPLPRSSHPSVTAQSIEQCQCSESTNVLLPHFGHLHPVLAGICALNARPLTGIFSGVSITSPLALHKSDIPQHPDPIARRSVAICSPCNTCSHDSRRGLFALSRGRRLIRGVRG